MTHEPASAIIFITLSCAINAFQSTVARCFRKTFVKITFLNRTIAPLSHHLSHAVDSLLKARFSILPTARMPASGLLMIAVKLSISNIPRLLMVKVPPDSSSGFSLFSLVRAARSLLIQVPANVGKSEYSGTGQPSPDSRYDCRSSSPQAASGCRHQDKLQ